jgi:hypothetical protein
MPNGASRAWYHVAWLSQHRNSIAGGINRKTYRIEIDYGKGGSAFIHAPLDRGLPALPPSPPQDKPIHNGREDVNHSRDEIVDLVDRDSVIISHHARVRMY